ncbi:MAG: DNA-directed RNA polymerase subunit alpha C-terminal domain-containing protein [Clostridium sp.]
MGIYECVKGFLIERCDDDGFIIDGGDYIVPEGSLWVTPEEKDYRFIGGEVRLENKAHGWLEITNKHLEEYFKELRIVEIKKFKTDDIGLSVRARRSLTRAGINTLEDLINRKEEELDIVRNLGKKSKAEVIEKVKSLGLEFIK